nr:MAG TPA: hypothetical protein [Caudoviricetes sp.]
MPLLQFAMHRINSNMAMKLKLLVSPLSKNISSL